MQKSKLHLITVTALSAMLISGSLAVMPTTSHAADNTDAVRVVRNSDNTVEVIIPLNQLSNAPKANDVDNGSYALNTKDHGMLSKGEVQTTENDKGIKMTISKDALDDPDILDEPASVVLYVNGKAVGRLDNFTLKDLVNGKSFGDLPVDTDNNSASHQAENAVKHHNASSDDTQSTTNTITNLDNGYTNVSDDGSIHASTPSIAGTVVDNQGEYGQGVAARTDLNGSNADDTNGHTSSSVFNDGSKSSTQVRHDASNNQDYTVNSSDSSNAANSSNKANSALSANGDTSTHASTPSVVNKSNNSQTATNDDGNNDGQGKNGQGVAARSRKSSSNNNNDEQGQNGQGVAAQSNNGNKSNGGNGGSNQNGNGQNGGNSQNGNSNQQGGNGQGVAARPNNSDPNAATTDNGDGTGTTTQADQSQLPQTNVSRAGMLPIIGSFLVLIGSSLGLRDWRKNK